jgi:hypothetical protein
MSLPEQLGNVGSDFERALRWKEKNQSTLFISAITRTLELMDLTLADTRWHNHRLKELARIRDEVCNVLFNEATNKESVNGLKKYFFSMAKLGKNTHMNPEPIRKMPVG